MIDTPSSLPANLPDDMCAVEIAETGGPNVLTPTRRPVPRPEAGEILIAVEAAGVNRPDVLQRSGVYPPPPGASDLPGLEVAGRVVMSSVGARFQVGDKVCALANGGGYAEYCVVPAAQALPIPGDLSMIEAAGLPETFFTVWTNLFERAALGAGERLLVHGGTSGIGTTAIQLARQRGVRVFTTAGSDAKCRACRDLGAEVAINYRSDAFDEAIMAATDDEGVDVVLDMVGGDYVKKNLAILRPEGRLVQIAFLASPKIELNMLPIMLKRLTVTGSTLRPQSVAAKARIAVALEREVWPLLASRTIGPVMDSTYSLTDAAAAHARMESGDHIGKIVLSVK